MEELLEILKDILPDVDVETCTTLIDDDLLESFELMSLVSELKMTYGIQIRPADLKASNFNSAEAIYAMVTRLQNQ